MFKNKKSTIKNLRLMKLYIIIIKWIALVFAMIFLFASVYSSISLNPIYTSIYAFLFLLLICVFVVLECRSVVGNIEIIKYSQDGYMCSTRCPYKTDYKFVGAYACRQCDCHVFQNGDRMEVGCKFKYLHR